MVSGYAVGLEAVVGVGDEVFAWVEEDAVVSDGDHSGHYYDKYQ